MTIAREKTAAGQAAARPQVAYIVPRAHKPAALDRVLDMENPTSALVFCRTRLEVDELTETLSAHGYRAEALHGGMAQRQRDRVLRPLPRHNGSTCSSPPTSPRAASTSSTFRTSSTTTCRRRPTTTCIASAAPGSAGREGIAITLVEPREHRLLRNIEHQTKRKISIPPVPTAHDLRARRLDLTRAALEEALAEGELDKYRMVVESLATEHDVLDLAAAAVKLADKARGGDDDADADIPSTPASLPPAFLQPKGGGKKPPRAAFAARAASTEMTKLWIGLGRASVSARAISSEPLLTRPE